MKINEAPEKIYLQDSCTTDTIDDLWPEWFDAKISDNSIEYVRKDDFIEKACDWLDKHTFYELNLDLGYSLQIKEFIDLFKQYMKGE